MKIFPILLLLFSFLYAGEKVSLQLKWKHSFQFAGFYMAKEKGFYRDAGLDVTIRELEAGTNLAETVARGESTYGIGDSALIYYKLQQSPIVLLMPILEKTPLALLTTRNIERLSDFHQDSITINAFSLKSPAVLSMLHLSHIDIGRFQPRDGVYPVEEIAKGELDLYSVYAPNQPFYLKKRHIPYHLFKPEAYGLHFYGDILFTSEKERETHFERCIRFMEASKRGWRYAMRHIRETVDLILKKYNSQNFSKEELLYQARTYQRYLTQTFQFDRQKLENIKIIFKLLYKIKGDFDYHEFVFNRFIATKRERDFLKTHDVRCATTTDWAPFNLLREGQVEGLGIDYWHLVARKLDIGNRCEPVDNFSQLLKMIQTKQADLTISTSETPERRKYALFSIPYATFPIAIATRREADYVDGIKALADRPIAVARDYTATRWIQRKYPNLRYIETDNLDASLELVRTKRAYATVEILPVLAYRLNQQSHDLKINGTTDLNFPVRLMIRNDYAPLLPMINRAIASIDENTKKDLFGRWISVEMQTGYSREKINKMLLVAFALFALLLAWALTLVIQIRRRKRAEAALDRLANYDQLTQIYNRHKIDLLLKQQLSLAKRYSKHFSILFFDIDDFKAINDTYGHKTGDTVLRELASLVQSNIRESDLFGRWGGEEFLILCPESDQQEAAVLAEKLRRKIEQYHFSEVQHITCSFGVTQVGGDDTIESAIIRVDRLLYKAKSEGKNRVVATLSS